MKKFFAVIGVLVCLIIIALIVVWASKTRIAQRALQKELGVPVSIEKLSLSLEEAEIKKIHIGNPKGSQTKTAFSSEKILIESNIRQILSDPLIIDVIELDNAFIGVEFYGSKEADSNWTKILNYQPKSPKKKKDTSYLIRSIYVNNLTVSVTKSDGKTTVYPTLKHLEFHNISDDSGLPIDEIEKAIFKLVLQSVIEEYGIESILKSISPKNLPFKLLPFFDKREQKKSEPQQDQPNSPEEKANKDNN